MASIDKIIEQVYNRKRSAISDESRKFEKEQDDKVMNSAAFAEASSKLKALVGFCKKNHMRIRENYSNGVRVETHDVPTLNTNKKLIKLEKEFFNLKLELATSNKPDQKKLIEAFASLKV